ncbi:hypothetical protein H2198_003285 [Neophaeococcomyces mojaviensis]|uniref:Uncharacterized protein n=1 Tax=Neophaeococcomyces mojaviensis TaxID=3383035 RepID=A0ACC3ABQ1_9EURO|nr:hypothetical protein H2198_003285 [Knufia sp. JES_112]
MSPSALEGASKYLNNLLLARGFLQDGKPIDFGSLADHSNDSKSGKFDRYATTTILINLIHDLILRRDRDAEQHESLVSTIRTLRAEESQRLLDFQRLQDKNVQLKNDVSSAEAQQRTLAIATKKAQAEARDLKEQTLKMKSTLDQVRAKCISDIRKRDVELDKLKNHLSGLNRGKKESAAGGMKINTINIQQKNAAGRELRGGQEVNGSMEWTLENETNDFLAAVVNEASTENVALRKIVGDSMNYLKSLTGLDEQERQQEAVQRQSIVQDKAIGIPGQYRDRNTNTSSSSTQSESLIPVQSLATSMSEVLSHCQSILRDPSFVPIEEVQIRDEEIQKLRVGWEKMADRWKEAVTMMSQWRQKMMGDAQEPSRIDINSDAGEAQDPFTADGLADIAAFRRSIAVRPNGQPVLDAIEEEELTSMLLDHHSRIMADQSSVTIEPDQEQEQQSDIRDDETLPEPDEAGTPRQTPFRIQPDQDIEAEESDLDLAEQTQPALQIIASPARRGIKLHKPTMSPIPASASTRHPLSSGNANSKKRKANSTSSSPRKRRSVSPPCTDSSSLLAPSITSNSIDTTDPLHLDSRSDTENDDIDLFLTEEIKSATSNIPRMTVAQKLAAVEVEASEATEVIRRRQATTYTSTTDRRARDRARKSSVPEAAAKTDQARSKAGRDVRKSKDNGKNAAERDKMKKMRDRRRSTLTPGELGTLMGR